MRMGMGSICVVMSAGLIGCHYYLKCGGNLYHCNMNGNARKRGESLSEIIQTDQAEFFYYKN